jgi:hypothetical protein
MKVSAMLARNGIVDMESPTQNGNLVSAERVEIEKVSVAGKTSVRVDSSGFVG